MKKKIVTFVVKTSSRILGQHSFERLLLHGCRRVILRKCLRLGTLAYEFSSYLTENSIRLAQLDDYSLYVNLQELPGVSSYFFGYSDSFPFLDLILRKGDIFVDAGANMGQYTFLAASLVKDTGKVFAFEPNKDILTLLKKSVAVNKWEDFVVVDDRALWSQEGKRTKFYLSNNPHNSGTSSLLLHEYGVTEDHYIDVETTTLDSYFSEHHIEHCRLLKIDVERVEYEVLQGFLESLKKQTVDVILIEMFCPSSSYDVLTDFGYKGFFVEPGKGLTEIERINDTTFGDFLFVSPASYDELMQLYPSIHSRLKQRK